MTFSAQLETVMAHLGEGETLALAGLVVGVIFGVAAQRSRFCLRSAVLDLARARPAKNLAVWLFAFSTAIIGVQALVVAGVLEIEGARQLASTGSLSGAAIGGLMLGVGMILCRGCPSRLIVLAANGNLRAVFSSLVFALVAYISLHGALAPERVALFGLSTLQAPDQTSLLAQLGLDMGMGVALAALWLVGGIVFARGSGVRACSLVGGVVVGLTIVLGWFATYQISALAFDAVVPLQSVSLTGPAVGLLERAASAETQTWDFDLGLLPGVFLGAAVAGLLGRDWKIEVFPAATAVPRYAIGAALMGFGGVLAGGCAVGAGVTGGAIFAITAWVTLTAIWASATAADWLIDRDGLALIGHRLAIRNRPAAQLPAE